MATRLFYLALVVFCGWAHFFSSVQGSNTTCPPIYSSCKEAYYQLKCKGTTPKSGEYVISYLVNGAQVYQEVYCDMEGANCEGVGGWMRVAQLDMTLNYTNCPPGLMEGMYGSKRLCGN